MVSVDVKHHVYLLTAMSSFPQKQVAFLCAHYMGADASASGDSLHCFLVHVIKSYVIATADLWLFIHASNLLPSLPTQSPYNNNNSNSGFL